MHFQTYHTLPKDAKTIREAVFMKEQGFNNEFDDVDTYATHIVLYDEETPVGTCRFFTDDSQETYFIGRIAVIKSHRQKHLGSGLLHCAEEAILAAGGKRIHLHAQCRAQAFYEKQGFHAFGDIALDEGCPHIWMEKSLSHTKKPHSKEQG